MKRSLQTCSLATIALFGLFAGSLFAQNGDGKKSKSNNDSPSLASIKHEIGKLELDLAHVHVHGRTAIPHKPLEMVDPKTGKKVTADKMIDLPGGKKKSAGEYYAELNKLEKKFNALGYTLSDKTGGKVLLQASKIDEKELDNHAKTLAAHHLAFAANSMRAIPSHDDILQKQTAAQKADADRLKNLANANVAGDQAKTSTASKKWNYTIGNKKLVAAYLSGKLEIKGSQDEVSALAEARAGGYVINREVNLIKANGSVRSPAKGQSKASLHVYLLGQHIINVDKSADLNWQVSDTKQHGIDVHAEFHFAIGPVPMVAHIGARGNVGVRYMAALRPAHATFQVSPFVDARVYVKAGVDAWLVSGGGGGEVTLLKDQLKIGAELNINFDPTRGPSLQEHFYVQNDMTILSGKVYAWAKVNYFIGSKEWHFDLWNWKGIHSSGYLVNQQRTTYLIPNYQAVAAQ